MRIVKMSPESGLKSRFNQHFGITNRLSAALSLVLATLLTTLPLISASQAADFIIPASPPIFPTQNITGGDSVTILQGGIIMDAGDGIFSNGFNTSVTVDNAGTITSTGANGIRTFDNLTLFNNTTGVITGANQGVDAYNLIQAINSGIIEGTDDAINSFGVINSLINSGTIRSTNGDGVESFFVINNLINSGTIEGGNRGVYVSFFDIDKLENSGTITGGTTGISVNRNIDDLTNSGTIVGTNNAGIFAQGNIGTLINSGSIIGGQRGVHTILSLTTLINTGTIIGQNNTGIRIQGNVDTLDNSGTIIGITGIDVNFNLTSLINTGTIIGQNGNGIIAGFFGADHGITSLTNAGVITGTVNAIHSLGGTDTHLILLPGSDIFGDLNLGGGANTLTVGKGLSIDHVFATLPQIINTNGQPLFIDGKRVVVVATDDLNQQHDTSLFDLTQGIFNTVFNNIGDGRNPGGSFVNGPQFSLGAVSPEQNLTSNDTSHMWASVFGSRRNDDDSRQNLGGLIVGLDGKINSSLRLGAFFGTSRTNVDFSSAGREMETDSIFGGLYASLNAGNLQIDLGITGGETDHDGTRLVDNNRVNGLQTVSSNFDGTFIAPELSISTLTDFGGTTIKPTLRVGYAGLFLDGYTETGTNAAPIKFGENDIHIIHARLEIAALMNSKGDDSLNFQYSPYIGIEGRSLIDGEATNISLFGQTYNFNANGDEDVGSAFAGLRLSILQTENFGIFAGIEGSIDTESSTLLTANAGLKWRF